MNNSNLQNTTKKTPNWTTSTSQKTTSTSQKTEGELRSSRTILI